MTQKKTNSSRSEGNSADQPTPSVFGFTDASRQKWVEVDFRGAKALIEYRQFAADRSGIWATLSDNGVVIVSAAVRKSIIEQVEHLEAFPHRLIFARPGWCQGQFVTAAGRVFAPRRVEKGAVAFKPNPAKCSRRGNHGAWLAQIGRHLADHPIPSFFIMACFAAPLLEMSGRTDNFGFELVGEGGKGKATTQRLMASVVGPAMEKERGYISTFYSTHAALEQSMLWHSDMPFIIDEANLFGSATANGSDKRAMRDFGFQMGSGTTKGRFNDPQQVGYRFVFVTSANQPFNASLGGTHRDVSNAATDRLMSITVPPGDAGVFGPLPADFETYRQFTLALETAMTTQYGTAMPRFLRALVNARHSN